MYGEAFMEMPAMWNPMKNLKRPKDGKPDRYIIIGAPADVDVDTLPFIEIPEGVTRIYLGPNCKVEQAHG
jgi:hypothetical protein